MKSKLDKSDYYDIGLIVLFSLYAYFVKGHVASVFSDSAAGLETPGFSFLTYLAPLAIFAWFLFRIKSGGSVSESKWGLPLGSKPSWISLGFASATGILLVIVGWNRLSFTLEGVTLLAPVILHVAAIEIVLRAVLIELVLRIFGKGRTNSCIAIILSTLIFIVVTADVDSLTLKVAIGYSLGALLYLGTRCLLLPLFADVGYIVSTFETPDISDSLVWPYVIIIPLLYFALALSARWMQKRIPKEIVQTSQVQA